MAPAEIRPTPEGCHIQIRHRHHALPGMFPGTQTLGCSHIMPQVTARLGTLLRRHAKSQATAQNHIYLPLLATRLTLMLFFPGIIQHRASYYQAVSRQTQQPFLARWLLITVGFFTLSALVRIVKRDRAPRRTRWPYTGHHSGAATIAA